MFKSAATKIAHNSTLPALAGNQDLRPLQDLITAEKTVILSLQRLATDLSKASEALKAWGLGEGDDLGDVLTASATILTHFTSALSQYASHGHFMREQLKSIRTREETLDDLKRRRRTINTKADAAEKKLQKMNPEHKNFVAQTDLLNRLRDEIRGMDVDVMKDEAALGDLKRSATRSWVGLKFGGLIECCEKGVIAGEYGKLVVSEIPNDQTQPGLPRTPYFAHSRIGDLVAEAHRCVNEVRLSTVPSNSPPPQQLLPQVPHVSDSPFMSQGAFSPSPYPHLAEPHSDDPARRNWENAPVDRSPQHQYSHSVSNAGFSPSSAAQRVDEFGNPIDAGGSSRFATFPIKTRSASASGAETSLIATPPPLSDRTQSESFSSSVAQALAASIPSSGEPVGKEAAPLYEVSDRKSIVEEGEEDNGRQVRFGRVDDISEKQAISEQVPGQGPQARLARLLENEEEGEEKALDAAVARKVGLELNIPDGDQQVVQQPTTATYVSSPPIFSPLSPVGLERAPTYTEKPVYTPPGAQYDGALPSFPNRPRYSYSYYNSPQQQMSPPGQVVYPPGGGGDDKGKESDFYNPYDESSSTPNSIPSPAQFFTPDGGITPPPNRVISSPPPLSQPISQAASPLRVSMSMSGTGESLNLDGGLPSPPYLRQLGGGGSNASLNSVTGGGKISAAAFKRPSPRVGSGVLPLRVAGKGGELEDGGGEKKENGTGAGVGAGAGEGGEGGDVGVGVGTYFYDGVGGGELGKGKFESK